MTEEKKRRSDRILAVCLTFAVSAVAGILTGLIFHFASKDALPLMLIGAGADAFFFSLAIGFVLTGVFIRDKFAYVVAFATGALGVLILMALCGVNWWVILIIGIAAALLVLIVPYLLYRDTLAMEYSDEKPDHKTYEEQKAERAEKEKEEEELPEIKSFKD